MSQPQGEQYKINKSLAAEAACPRTEKELAYQEILIYHVPHEKSCLSKIVERVPNCRFWTYKAKDSA
jgi:hypothetical protein